MLRELQAAHNNTLPGRGTLVRGEHLCSWLRWVRRQYADNPAALDPGLVDRLQALPNWSWASPPHLLDNHAHVLVARFYGAHRRMPRGADVAVEAPSIELGARCDEYRAAHAAGTLDPLLEVRLEGVEGWSWQQPRGRGRPRKHPRPAANDAAAAAAAAAAGGGGGAATECEAALRLQLRRAFKKHVHADSLLSLSGIKWANRQPGKRLPPGWVRDSSRPGGATHRRKPAAPACRLPPPQVSGSSIAPAGANTP